MKPPFRSLNKVKVLLYRLLPVRRAPDVSESGHLNAGGGIFGNSHDFVMNHSTAVMLNVQGEHSVSTAMMLLSRSVISGAEYDSSSRDPPPRCHPGTRTKLIEDLTKWFEDKHRRKSFLWMNGPAGVGKSAIVQTLTESLASSQWLGAAIFFSRLHKRNDPRKTFITLAYQLAVRIPNYRTYIAERLVLDPNLVDKGVKEQFQIFIVEPFAQKQISKSEHPRIILLDGLDECSHQNQQCEIIRLIGAFSLDYPDVPLIWIIASRPEPHISTTFAEKTIADSHWEEFVPVDSTDGCKDVERYLTARFHSIQNRFPLSVPQRWPSDTQYLKLSRAAAGLFVFAETAVRFIDDDDIGDPVSQLDLLLSVIDKLVVVPTEDQPFAALDTLYTQILVLVPSRSWPLTKQILGFALSSGRGDNTSKTFPLQSRGLVGAAEILGLDDHVVYGCLHKLHSVLAIPTPKKAVTQGVSFIHASFADFLTDLTRAKTFFVDPDWAAGEIIGHLFDMMQNFVEGLPSYSRSSSYDAWIRHCGEAHSCESWGIGKKARHDVYGSLFRDIQMASFDALTRQFKVSPVRMLCAFRQGQSESMDVLARINTTKLYTVYFLDVLVLRNFHVWITTVWKEFSFELKSRGLIQEVQLKDLEFGHLSIDQPLPSHYDYLRVPEHLSRLPALIDPLMETMMEGPYTPDSPSSLRKYISMLRNLQNTSPELQVLIVGSSPEKRSAFFCHEIHDRAVHGWCNSLASGTGYYCVPYGR